MPKEKKTRTESEYQELKAATTALAKCAILTLEADGKFGGGSGLMIDLKTKKISRWQEQFFDALDLAGIEYDREAYYAQKPSRKRRR